MARTKTNTTFGFSSQLDLQVLEEMRKPNITKTKAIPCLVSKTALFVCATIAVITVTSGLDTQARLIGHFPLY